MIILKSQQYGSFVSPMALLYGRFDIELTFPHMCTYIRGRDCESIVCVYTRVSTMALLNGRFDIELTFENVHL